MFMAAYMQDAKFLSTFGHAQTLFSYIYTSLNYLKYNIERHIVIVIEI